MRRARVVLVSCALLFVFACARTRVSHPTHSVAVSSPNPPASSISLSGDPWEDVLAQYNLEFVGWDSSEAINDEGERIILVSAYVRPRGNPESPPPISLFDWINSHPRTDMQHRDNELSVVRRNFSRAATIYVAWNAVVDSEYLLMEPNRSEYIGHLVRGVQLTVNGRTRSVDAYVEIEPVNNGHILGRYREVVDAGRRRILFYLVRDTDGTGTLEPVIADDGSLARNFDRLFSSTSASAPSISHPGVGEGVVVRPIVLIQRNRDAH